MACVYVLMGVSGSGKSTVGQALARELDCPFYDGDDFHSAENVARMSRGVPLDDSDRYPWLARLNALIADQLARGETAVLTCSALKKKYRDQLREGNRHTVFVYLEGDFELIWERMAKRRKHYMKPEMLKSQFEALEPPDAAEAYRIGVDQDVDAIVRAIRSLDTPNGD